MYTKSDVTAMTSSLFTRRPLLIGWLLVAVAVRADDNVTTSSSSDHVDVDLRHGIVKGYSQYVTFVVSPSPTVDDRCSAQSIVGVDLTRGPFNRVRLTLDYSEPRLWTVDVSDSIHADGYGVSHVTVADDPDSNTGTGNMAEAQVFNEQMRIYGNDLAGHRDVSIDGGHLLKVVDRVVNWKHSRMVLDISDGRVEWRTRRSRRQFIESKYLFSLRRGSASRLYVGLNRVIAGDFRSGSGLCRALISLFADRIDRCRSGHNQCHADAVCHNTTKAYRCRCKRGFYGNGKICVDHNECEYENAGCVHSCHNTHGAYSCSCLAGFQLHSDTHNCIDVDECAVNNGGCEHVCTNVVGSYRCTCHPGYFLAVNGKNCVAGSNWCYEQLGCAHHCESNALGTKCVCRKGYQLHDDGKDCVATCSLGNGGCQHRCTDSSDGPVCSCHNKYTLTADRSSCTATCGVNNGGCDRRCEDTDSGPVCSCPTGLLLDESDLKTCLDVDECAHGDGGCSHECVNTQGSYECVCPPGYRVADDMKTCRDVDECQYNHTCDHVCTNTDGSFQCTCSPGYELYGGTHCADKNECSVNNGGCEHTCENSEGSYRCDCHSGYQLHSNKRDCVELVSCPTLRVPAKASLNCSPAIGRRIAAASTDLQVCQLSCSAGSEFIMSPGAANTGNNGDNITTWCGSQTGYRWLHQLQNVTLPSCSEQVLAPGYKGRARFKFFAERCPHHKNNFQDFEQQLSPILVGESNSCEDERCTVTVLELKCGRRKRKFRHLSGNNLQTLMSAEFEMQVRPVTPTDKCGVDCSRTKNFKRIRRSLRRLRRIINNNRETFAVHYEGKNYEVLRKSLRAYRPRDVCEPGQVLMNNKCVSCSLATWYNSASGSCEPCPAGTYQDLEGQLACKPCPHGLLGVGIEAAKSVNECGVACRPGTYSVDGLTPCKQCPVGTYQSDYGRTLCLPCGPGIRTSSIGATGFQDCVVNEHCEPGQFYSRVKETCVLCPRDSYQPIAGQNFCVDCPGYTQTDTNGANSSSQCKDRTCIGETTGQQGYIQSPNWPGLYPANVECTWRITPERGRRILVVIPEIFIASQDKCQDSLVMRKSASPYSLTTYETCESSSTPLAFTARTRNLWIYFKTNSQHSANGFSIPYVTYNEEYQQLIDDIVRDGRLYSSHQHRQVLKDTRLLSALLEVIAQPYNYFKYTNVSQTMFPPSFIRLLRNKVVSFFS